MVNSSNTRNYSVDDPNEPIVSNSCMSFGLEWTQEQHLDSVSGAANRENRLRKGLGALVPKLLGGSSLTSNQNNYHKRHDSISLGSDAAVQSVGSVTSAANVTIDSTDTVKASNRANCKTYSMQGDGLLKKRWDKVKNVFGLKIAPDQQHQRQQLTSGNNFVSRGHSYSADYATSNRSSVKNGSAAATPPFATNRRFRPRLGSFEHQQSKTGRRVRSNPMEQQVKQFMHDQSVICRLDGLDAISLGPAQFESLPMPAIEDGADEIPASADALWELSPSISCTATGIAKKLTPAKMINNMLWTSSGSEIPEIVLEGFVPGADNRWSVRVEQREIISSDLMDSSSCFCGADAVTVPWSDSDLGNDALTKIYRSTSPRSLVGSELPGLFPANSHSDDCETSEELSMSTSTAIPTVHLWSTLWGEKAPPHATLEAILDDDPLLTLAAENSIPIDLDENTFCVSERSHLETIHSFIGVSLSMGRFGAALRILKKLLQGIELLKDRMSEDYQGLRFMRGATMHNIGVIYMYQGDYENALMNFHEAIQERQKTLPKDHPDIAVSIARKAMMHFAIGRFEEALFGMQLAVPLTHETSGLRSKLLNNMGVINFMKRNFASALNDFTASLEIQRMLLEGEIRRDAIVFDAATTLGNMGKLYMEREDYQLSYYAYEEALLMLTTIFRKDHDLVLSNLTSLALVRAKDDQAKNALLILQGCLRSQNARFGKESTPCVETMSLMGALYNNVGCLEDALKCFLLVMQWQRANLASDHPSRRQVARSIDKIQERLGKSASMWV
ncbi:hypothetical protein MPSEU_000879900 [Mayamaea pseudoterrestris]|nr:hypothetical protein MPSEU_000879900 [Mayamaea pseudoterrestris]